MTSQSPFPRASRRAAAESDALVADVVADALELADEEGDVRLLVLDHQHVEGRLHDQAPSRLAASFTSSQ